MVNINCINRTLSSENFKRQLISGELVYGKKTNINLIFGNIFYIAFQPIPLFQWPSHNTYDELMGPKFKTRSTRTSTFLRTYSGKYLSESIEDKPVFSKEINLWIFSTPSLSSYFPRFPLCDVIHLLTFSFVSFPLDFNCFYCFLIFPIYTLVFFLLLFSLSLLLFLFSLPPQQVKTYINPPSLGIIHCYLSLVR